MTMPEIKLKTRYKAAGDVFNALLAVGFDPETAGAFLNDINDADVVEVRHGEWDIKSRSYRMIDDYDEEIYVECPFCKRTFYVPYEFDDEKTIAYARENYPYCHCGAKMDGERKDKP